MYVLAPPPAPSDVNAIVISKRLIVTWVVPKVPRVPLTFNVTLKTKVNHTETVILQGTRHWPFNITEQTCGPYQLKVEVSNIAGKDSTTVTGKLQDCSAVRRSHCYYSLLYMILLLCIKVICH